LLPKIINTDILRITVLTDVLCGFKYWTTIIKEECKSKVFKNRMMKENVKGE